jgi:phosphopantetheine--protein transferase-like protein
MPLFYQHNINDSTKLAVWHITENEDFFLEKVTIKKEVTHPHKRLQHLAGRYLLQILHPDFPLHLIEIAESKKPLLSNGEFHFSISHCGDFAAAIVSESKPVGIDVELITPKIELVKNKFLSESEINLSTINNHQLLTLFWSSKEAIFKWYGKGGISFKKNIILDQLFMKDNKGFINTHFIKGERTDLKLEFRFFGKLCLAWV